MIIKSISIENFQCYSGNLVENQFVFRKGLNVVIGDNGSGKSKLYDAFFWVLYDKVFDSTTRQLIYTSEVGINLISDKAKSDCVVGEKVTAKVQLLLHDYKTNSTYPEEYLLERSFSIQKVKELFDYNDLNGWKLSNASISTLEKKDIFNFKPVYGSDAFERIVQKLIPTDMSRYLWFQGEQVDSLIDFKNENSLTQAINILSDISYYDLIIDIANKVAKQADTAYKSEIKDKSRNEVESSILTKNQDDLEKLIETEEANLMFVNENLENADDYKNDLLAKIKDAQELESLKVELRNSKGKVNSLREKLDVARKGFNGNLFCKQWILRNGSSYFKKFEFMFNDYESEREERKVEYRIKQQQEIAKKNRLPENVPNATYLKQMLSDKQCFLCDRGFEEGDHASDFINELYERTKTSRVKTSDIVVNDFKAFFQQLYNNGYSLKTNFIDNVDASIKAELIKIETLEEKLKDAVSEYEMFNERIEHLLGTSTINADESKDIVRDFRQYDSDKEKFQEQKFQIEGRLKDYNDRLKGVLDKLRTNVGDAINQETIEKKEVLDAFNELAVSTRRLVFEEQIKKIEDEANKHFQCMSSDNLSVQGRIILKKHGNSYMPKNVDDNGIELTSINDSNIILIKLSTIMAIVTAKGKSEFHPLISDAPTSKFSDNYTMGFCNTVDDVFTQSIVLSKDFYHNLTLRSRLLNEIDNLGAVYLIEPSIKEDIRSNRKELSTKITPLN